MSRNSFAPDPRADTHLPDRQRWDRRYAASHPTVNKAMMPLLATWLPRLPRRGLALDVAAGAGRHSLALARHGLRVHALDISWQGLRLLRARAVPPLEIRPLVIDLRRGWLPEASYRVIVNFLYLERALWPAMARRLAPGGWLIVETFTVEQRRLAPGKYIRPEFLLEPGELRAAFSFLEIVHYAEGVHNGKATAQLVARKGLGAAGFPLSSHKRERGGGGEQSEPGEG